MGMKWEKITKTKRNCEILEYHRLHPESTMQEIAEVFNISRQRVHQILRRNNGQKV